MRKFSRSILISKFQFSLSQSFSFWSNHPLPLSRALQVLRKKNNSCASTDQSTIRYESTTRQHQQQREQQPPSLEGQIEFKRNSHNVFGKNVFALQHTCHIAIALDRQRKTTYPIPNSVHKHIAVRSFVGTSRNYHLTCVLRQTRFVIGAILFVLRLLL